MRVSGALPRVDDTPVVFGWLEVTGIRGLVPLQSLHDSEAELWRCGFHPDRRFWIKLAHTNEYGLDGCFVRPLFALRCMRGGAYLRMCSLTVYALKDHSNNKILGFCTLYYDGEEDAMFRWTATTMFCRALFEQFQQSKGITRFGLIE